MRVLVVDEALPFPPDSGKRLRTYNLIKRLCVRHEVTYLARGGTEELPGCPGVEVVLVDEAVTAQRGLRFYAELLANVASGLPYVVTRHASPAFRQAVDRAVSTHGFDLIHCEWTPYAQNLLHLAGRVPMLLMTHNVESMIWARYFATAVNLFKKAYIGLQWRKMERFEASACQLFDEVCCVSGEDAAVMREHFACPHVSVVPNGVDTQYFAPMDVPAAPASMVFTGSMDWRPNQDGIGWFVDAILPRIRQQMPQAGLDIVGRNPPAALARQWAAPGGVRVSGTVPDVRPAIAGSGLYVVPLRVGGGSRLKILEALAMGKPVLSTTLGAEGLHLEADKHLVLRDDPDSFARQAAAMLSEPERYAAMARNGRDRVLEEYGWDGIADTLEEAWLRAIGNFQGTAQEARHAQG